MTLEGRDADCLKLIIFLFLGVTEIGEKYKKKLLKKCQQIVDITAPEIATR